MALELFKLRRKKLNKWSPLRLTELLQTCSFEEPESDLQSVHKLASVRDGEWFEGGHDFSVAILSGVYPRRKAHISVQAAS